MKKKYRIRKGSLADIVIRNRKGLAMIAVASIILAGMSAATLAFAGEQSTMNQPKSVEVTVEKFDASTMNQSIPAAEVCEEVNTEPELVSLGEFTISHYCSEPYHHICNNGDYSQTATLTIPTVGRTIAVDPDVIPYGSEVMIDGHVYVAEDCGGAINEKDIDILVTTHDEANQLGMFTTEVFLVKGGAEDVQN